MASTSVSVRVPDELMKKLEARAIADNEKVSDVVRRFIESGLKAVGGVDHSGVPARIDKLEESIKRMLGVEDVSVIGRLDSVNSDFWQANTSLISYIAKAIEEAAEARYFARLNAMFGLDIAHYVAQKVEIGKMPEPLDKGTKDTQLATYDRGSNKYSAEILAELGNDKEYY